MDEILGKKASVNPLYVLEADIDIEVEEVVQEHAAASISSNGNTTSTEEHEIVNVKHSKGLLTIGD